MVQDSQKNNLRKLFVGSLAFQITEMQLKAVFSQFGRITELKLITDRHSGKSRGIAFIEFQNQAEANEAIKHLNNAELAGRKIIVNIAKPKQMNDSPSDKRRQQEGLRWW